MKRKILLPIGLFAALAGGGIWYFQSRDAANDELMLYGNIDIRQVQLGFRVSGRISESLYDEGDAVKPGTLLARLDAVPFNDSLRSALARRDSAKAVLEKAVNGPRPAEIERARATVSERAADLVIARQTFERYAVLVQTSAVSQANLDQATATRDAAQQRLKAARDDLSLMEEGTRYEEIDVARADLRAAEAAVAAAMTSLADTELYAPSNGVIVSRVREPGSIVSTGESVFVVSLDEPVWVRAYVSEPYLGRVHPGQEVAVFHDTRPETPYKGVVGFVSPVAEFTPKSVETPDLRTDLVYRLRIVIDRPDQELRQGMPVSVRVPQPVAR